MKIFIIGISKTGKSTLSTYLSNKYNLEHIKSSLSIRNSFEYKESDFNNKQDFINAITEYSIELNQKVPNFISTYIKNNYDLTKNVIIEGIRNPNNFFDLFNINEDKVIFLDYLNNEVKQTKFENGIDVIKHYLNWNLELNIIPQNRIQYLIYSNYNEIQGLLNEKSLFN